MLPSLLTTLVIVTPRLIVAQQPLDHSMTTMQFYSHHDSAAAAARKAGDWATYKSHTVILDSLLNGHPNVRLVKTLPRWALPRGRSRCPIRR